MVKGKPPPESLLSTLLQRASIELHVRTTTPHHGTRQLSNHLVTTDHQSTYRSYEPKQNQARASMHTVNAPLMLEL